MRIEACFDSHVHWAATGEFGSRLRLEGLKSAADVSKLNLDGHHYRGEWLLGFGWDEKNWSDKPHKEILDRAFPDRPVAFARADGHGLWVNSEALRRAEPKDVAGGRIERDAKGEPTGILIDKAAEWVERKIPKLESLTLRRHLLNATKIFNEAGYTHIRDMTCDDAQWHEAMRLDDSGLLTLAVEVFFWLRDLDDLDRALGLCARARAGQSPNLRVKGLKVFLDGALGSEGAWLSKPYCGGDHHGLVLWQKEDLKTILRRAWKDNFEVAVHAIGDAASDQIADSLLELKKDGLSGKIHVEHGEILRPETIAKLRGLDVEFHLQPAHWLSDRHWLKDKVGDLDRFSFPWRKLQEAEIRFDFGSDSPIEIPSLKRCARALRESQEAGVPRLLGNPESYMGHRDHAWAPNSYTLFADEEPTQVIFRGEHLL